jgi:hypothetical protein
MLNAPKDRKEGANYRPRKQCRDIGNAGASDGNESSCTFEAACLRWFLERRAASAIQY